MAASGPSLSFSARLRATLNFLRSRTGHSLSGYGSKLAEGDILILGAGFSGLLVGIKLKEAGIPFTIIDKESDVGGTWLLNRYPGCACDVPAHLYSYSFEPNPDWSEAYAGSEEIHAYIKRVYEKYDLAPHTRLCTRLKKAEWMPQRQRWRVMLESDEVLEPRFLFSCVGALHYPQVPDVPGMERFRGKMFHSAEWDHGVDFTGKRVVVVGSGASAVQFVPVVAERAQRLVLLQRTPNWVIGRQETLLPARHYPEYLKWAYRNIPLVRAAYRTSLYWKQELALSVGGLFDARDHPRNQILRSQCRGYMAFQLQDKQLRNKVIPKYPLGCKRICRSDIYLESLCRSNVDVVVAGLAEVQEDGIVDTCGTKHQADVLLFGTGFEIGSIGKDVQILGTSGFTWSGDSAWRQGHHAYLGTTMQELPNTFIILGPNSGLGHNSLLLMAEAQADYALRLLKEALDHDIGSFAVKPRVLKTYNRWVQEQFKDKERFGANAAAGIKPKLAKSSPSGLYNAPGLREDYEGTLCLWVAPRLFELRLLDSLSLALCFARANRAATGALRAMEGAESRERRRSPGFPRLRRHPRRWPKKRLVSTQVFLPIAIAIFVALTSLRRCSGNFAVQALRKGLAKRPLKATHSTLSSAKGDLRSFLQEQFQEMQQEELKDLLRQRGQPDYGEKDDLVQRLVSKAMSRPINTRSKEAGPGSSPRSPRQAPQRRAQAAEDSDAQELPGRLRLVTAQMRHQEPPDTKPKDVMTWIERRLNFSKMMEEEERPGKTIKALNTDAELKLQRYFGTFPEMKETLRPQQVHSAKECLLRGGRCLIADEMGLGKTLTSLVVAQIYSEEWPLLVVAPTSVVKNWVKEVQRWLPHMVSEVMELSSSIVSTRRKDLQENWVKKLIFVLSYDQARVQPALTRRPDGSPYKVVILDEAHYIKTSNSQRTQVLLPVCRDAHRCILLTGTPVLNHAGETWTLMSALDPTLPPFESFCKRYCKFKRQVGDDGALDHQ
ncbi:unnamed protein product [Symbiodinium microadriaticum]|nr:unnamed protein product [Symbiodinium microadriaticum]